jgi:hypothetical protein
MTGSVSGSTPAAPDAARKVSILSRIAWLHRDARSLELLLHPALADAYNQPTLAEPVQRGQTASEDDRALEQRVEHAGA